MEKRSLSERDICTKFITPALRSSGWDEITQIREEVPQLRQHAVCCGTILPHHALLDVMRDLCHSLRHVEGVVRVIPHTEMENLR